MQALSDRQLDEVMDAIRDRHLAFVISMVGADYVPAKDVERLRRKGLIQGPAANVIQRAYEFGVLSDRLGEAQAQNMSFQEFLRSASDPDVLPALTVEDRFAVKALSRSLMSHIKGLGNVFDQKTHRVLVEADHGLRRKLAQRVKRELIQGVEHKKSVKAVAQALAKATGDVERDWQRVASTELHNAFIEGRARSIQGRHKGGDPVVFKRHKPDACPNCKRLYSEDGVTPRLFHLSELIANGTTNEGRKLSAWKPTLGCLHPYCQCTLHELPDGFGFDLTGRMVYQGR